MSIDMLRWYRYQAPLTFQGTVTDLWRKLKAFPTFDRIKALHLLTEDRIELLIEGVPPAYIEVEGLLFQFSVHKDIAYLWNSNSNLKHKHPSPRGSTRK